MHIRRSMGKSKDRKHSRNFNRLTGTVFIKPLSTNKIYLGRKRKSGNYRQFEKQMLDELPDCMNIPDRGALQLDFEFGVWSRASDLDNVYKSAIDCLSKKYHFNDNRIYKIIGKKILVPKGSEYIKFVLRNYNGEYDHRGK